MVQRQQGGENNPLGPATGSKSVQLASVSLETEGSMWVELGVHKGSQMAPGLSLPT